MHVEHRTLHPDQKSTQPDLIKAQNRLFDLIFNDDLEIYDDQGNLIAITSKDNPNLSQVLINLNGTTPGGAR